VDRELETCAEIGPHQLFAGAGPKHGLDALPDGRFEIRKTEPAAFVGQGEERPAERRADLRSAR
jgi:hypothetical protein